MNEYDYVRFLFLLQVCNSSKPVNIRDLKKDNPDLQRVPLGNQGEPFVAIGAYCLMPNHFHILIKEIRQGGITKFMLKLTTAYSMYFNKKYQRSGILFQGMFRAEHADSDEYLKYLFSYIHLNPIKLIQSDWKENGIKDFEKSKQFLDNYKYSSFCDYTNDLKSLIINKSVFPDYFPTSLEFKDGIFDWLKFKIEP